MEYSVHLSADRKGFQENTKTALTVSWGNSQSTKTDERQRDNVVAWLHNLVNHKILFYTRTDVGGVEHQHTAHGQCF